MIYQNTGPSGGKLAHLLGCSVRMPYKNQDRYSNWNKEVVRDRIIPPINYGCEMKYVPLECMNYHSELTKDKLYCFGIFEAAGIPYPKLINPEKYDKPFLGRKNNSSKGEGIVKYKAGSENWKKNKHDFYVEFINGVSEHRVYVWGNHIVAEANKDMSKNRHPFIKNFTNGSKLEVGYIKHPKRLNILDDCIAAVKYCGLDFGAIDIIIDDNNNYKILEVNSSPSFANIWGYLFAEHINRIFNLGINFEWTIDFKNKKINTPSEKFYFFKTDKKKS